MPGNDPVTVGKQNGDAAASPVSGDGDPATAYRLTMVDLPVNSGSMFAGSIAIEMPAAWPESP